MTTEPHHHHHQEGNNSFGEDDDNDDVLMASLSFHARDGAFRESLIIRMTCAAAAEKKNCRRKQLGGAFPFFFCRLCALYLSDSFLLLFILNSNDAKSRLVSAFPVDRVGNESATFSPLSTQVALGKQKTRFSRPARAKNVGIGPMESRSP